jgi:hypothetical protein
MSVVFGQKIDQSIISRVDAVWLQCLKEGQKWLKIIEDLPLGLSYVLYGVETCMVPVIIGQ